MDIDSWLRKLGLGQYEAAFRDNAIDEKVLPRLTAEDLKDLGVGLVGHRRTLLDAIAALRGDADAKEPPSEALPHAPASSQASAPPATVAPTAEAVGERRYLTVMFCDLVGSTGISAQLDAEEWRDLVGAYLDAASAAVTEMGGHVAKKLGDGLMALFGYPVAHENDAERAARAALAIQRALAELNRKNEGIGKPVLTARIGLESGPAVLDAAGEIYGDVANIAARVQALAEPGAVLVTARVQRQVAGLFVAEERGTLTLKGVPEPSALFKLVRASGGGRRSEQRNLTPLIGRADEMTMLLRRWDRARQGDGQLVMIVGEPGLGKSRLLEEFRARLADTPHTWVEWSCSQLLQNTPLHPIAEWGRQRFGGADVPAEGRLAELESSLAQVKLDPEENASLLAPLLDIPLPRERKSTFAAEELRRRQLAALTNWVMAGAKVQSVVLAFEDLHWADPTTLDVLRSIADRGALAPLFIVATTRPEFRPPWSMRSHHGTISLAPLDRAQVRDMVAELSARHALPRNVVEDVAARTGGVPLFVEEVTRLLLDRGEGGGGIQAIPPTLQQSLMARLDRLGAAREVAQIGSVIGRGFSYGLIRDVAGMENTALQAALEKLAEADIVLVQGLPPESDYRFKHALIQDAAYENLLKSRRQVLHRRAAEVLRDRFADTAAAEPETLAYHFTQAGLIHAAIEWWGKAGDQALRRSAFQEAISHLGKAIEMADKDGDRAPRAAVAAAPTGQRLKLQTRYGQGMMLSRGFASEESKAAFSRALELAKHTGDADERFDTYYGLFVSSLLRGNLAAARETAEAFRRDTERERRTTEAAAALRNVGMACLFLGDLAEAQEHLAAALRVYDPERDRDARFRFGTDSGAAQSYLAQVKWLLGEVEQARELIEESGSRAVQSGHAPTIALIHHLKGVFEILRGDAEAALRASEALVTLGREHNIALYLAFGSVHASWARARLGDCETGVTELRQAVTAYCAQGNKLYVPFYQGLLAEVEAERQGKEGGLVRIDEALALAERTGEHWSDAFLHRIRGEILLKRDLANTAPADEAFLTAIAIAQQQQARSFELRAALSLAKLYESTGRPADAHAVLAPTLEGFAPTPELPEIEEGQTLLATLAKADEVKGAAATRQRRLQLQTSYGRALMWSKGFGAAETNAAFTRAKELAASSPAPERFPAYYGLWVGSLLRGELASAREAAEIFLREANAEGRMTEVAVACRNLGMTCLWQGNLIEAQAHLEKSLEIYDPDRDRDSKFLFGWDHAAGATAILALTNWLLGNFGRARELMERAVARATEGGHVPTLANTCFLNALYGMLRGDATAAGRAAETIVELAQKLELAVMVAEGAMCSTWARARLGDGEHTATREFRQAIVAFTDQGNRAYVPLFLGELAKLEAEQEGTEAALTRINEALSLASETGERLGDSFLQRIRGEILWKHNPTNSFEPEEAFLAAVAVAQQQKAKGFELLAALSLANLYRSTTRILEAHDILASALEDFTPTSEMPEISEAQALLAVLERDESVKAELARRERRVQLQLDYGAALISARGYGAEETVKAFDRARELTAGVGSVDRLALSYGTWLGAVTTESFEAGSKASAALLAEATHAANGRAKGVAHRAVGATLLYGGLFHEAKRQFDQATSLLETTDDAELARRFNGSPRAAALILRALAAWVTSDFDAAARDAQEAAAEAERADDAMTQGYVYGWAAIFGAVRRDVPLTGLNSRRLLKLVADTGLRTWAPAAEQFERWSRSMSGDGRFSAGELRAARPALKDVGHYKIVTPVIGLLAAEAEVRNGRADEALALVEELITEIRASGLRWQEAELLRVSGEARLLGPSADPDRAGRDLEAAVAVAREQGARAFELRAALSLARLYQSTDRAPEAYAVLAPALEGFSPTPEFLEIEEAQTFLTALPKPTK